MNFTTIHTFLISLGVALGDGAGFGDGEFNKSASSSSKSPEDFSLVGFVSWNEGDINSI